MIPYGRQDVTQSDIDAVVAVLRSDFLTQGPAVPMFESAVADHCGAPHGIAVNSATAALHVACMSLGVGEGDSVWTVPTTFVASANCARYCGASIDFVDIDPLTANMCVEQLADKLAQVEKSGKLPKVVIPVHLCGAPCDMERIHALSAQYGFRVVEDASHAIGSRYRGEPVGSGRYSDITVFSFHPVKIITTGEGGMAVTRDGQLAARMQLLRSHGTTRDSSNFQNAGADAPAWYYEQHVLGYNYRMTDIQAALGASQLTRLEHYVELRNQLACRYGEMLSGLPLQLPTVAEGDRSAFHIYMVRVREEQHRSVYEGLRSRGIGANLHYIPVHLQPYYRALGFREGQFPEAEKHARSAITLPLYPTLTHAQQDAVVAALKELL